MKAFRFVLMFSLVVACSDDKDNHPQQVAWRKLGLDGKSVNEMQIIDKVLFVATTSGLFKKNLETDSDFSLMGFINKNVEAIEVIDDGAVLVSIFQKDGAQPPALYKTLDDGTTWIPLQTDFGGEFTEPIFDLEAHPEDNEILYATGTSVVAKSLNGGGSWSPVYGDWGGFATGVSVVEINPIGKELWAGGQGAIENGFLLRSKNEVDWDEWADLVDDPTVVKEITFSDKTPDEVFVGYEGALLKTTDGGETWQTLIASEQNRFYFGIGLQQQNPGRVYTGGWLKTPDAQPLTIFISDNGGHSWEEFSFAGESYGGILDLQITREADRDVLYLGLDKGGVYELRIGH